MRTTTDPKQVRLTMRLSEDDLGVLTKMAEAQACSLGEALRRLLRGPKASKWMSENDIPGLERGIADLEAGKEALEKAAQALARAPLWKIREGVEPEVWGKVRPLLSAAGYLREHAEVKKLQVADLKKAS